jgi:hypothetical protein
LEGDILIKNFQDINNTRKSLKDIRNNWEFYTSLAVFWIIFFGLLGYSLFLNNGHFIYSLDDAYIHMAIAKNFSQYGVWGVNNNVFSSTSSSLLYTLLISLIFLIFGPTEIVPLIINLFFANLLIYIVYYVLKIKNNVPSYAIFIALLSIIFFLPLHSLVFMGLEHTMQNVINLVFILFVSKKLSNVDSKNNNMILNKDIWVILLITPLVTMIRFEGMFLIIISAFLFLLKRKYEYSFLIFISGFLPIMIYGIISISNGWYFFPNPVVIKGSLLDFSSSSIDKTIDVFDPMDMYLYTPHLLVFFIGALMIFYSKCFKAKDVWNEKAMIALIFMFTSISQLFFATAYIKGIYESRYDAYLITIGVVLIFISISRYIPQRLSFEIVKHYFFKKGEHFEFGFFRLIAIIIIIFSFYTPLVYRGIETSEDIPQATNNVYEQQYQMGLFLQKYYNEKCVAANDIGAINYLSDIECVDLWGLGDMDSANAIMNDDLDTKTIYELAKRKDVKIAIVYESNYFGYEIPSEWMKAGKWTITKAVVSYSSKVSFYAVDEDEYDDLIENLVDFSRYLPNTVEESGNYTK